MSWFRCVIISPYFEDPTSFDRSNDRTFDVSGTFDANSIAYRPNVTKSDLLLSMIECRVDAMQTRHGACPASSAAVTL